MELDEQIIKLIEEKSKQESYLFVSLMKTDTGHLIVDFDTKENVVSETQRVTVRRTPSGTRLLDMHKDMISMLKHTLADDRPTFSVSKTIRLSSSPSRQESPTHAGTIKHSPPIDSKKQMSPKYNDKVNFSPSEDIPKVHKYFENESLTPSVNSNRPLSDLTEGKMYDPPQVSPTHLGWESKILEGDKSPSRSNKLENTCECPGENLVSFDWKSETPISDPKYAPQKTESTNDNFCKCPPPPIEYEWKPGDSFLIEKNDCICPPNAPLLDCINPASDIGIKKDCVCPQESQTSYSWKSATSKSLLGLGECDHLSELSKLYKQGNSNIMLKVRDQDGVVRKIQAVLTKTPSETIAIYSKDISSLGNINFEEKEYPVLLSKTSSGTYFIDKGQYDVKLNATLRKVVSGGMLVVPKSMKKQSLITSAPEEFFKVKVSGVKNDPVELPAVLRKTSSGNYTIVLDKEFEMRYRQTVNEYIESDSDCIVDLNMTDSGHYIIDLDITDSGHLVKKNALLVKSSSGNIKVLVQGPEFESVIDQSLSNDSSTSWAKPFGVLIDKLPASSRQFHRDNIRKSKGLEKKASSDTELYGKLRVKLQDNTCLLSEPSAILKKTDSGQYAIILNKESKKAFINNLQSYLATNSQGLVPVKRTGSGEIIIILNNNVEEKGRFGSLKITSSGNIYVVVDEKTVKGMTKESKKKGKASSGVDDARSKEVTRPIAKSVNKAVTTTCNARPNNCDCDVSKCVCEDLQIDWLPNNPQKQDPRSFWKKITGKPVKRDLTGDKDKTPHIVIKPACDCLPPKKKKFGCTEQCYYLLDSVCPYHTDRYDGVSNEILEITGLCNKAQVNLRRNKIEFEANTGLSVNAEKDRKVWDSLNFLPPQLPPFLNNITYR